jgi:hypothetical protein
MANWEPGDLALCVKDGKFVHNSHTGRRCTHNGRMVPPRGSIREVSRVEVAMTDRGTVFSCGCLNLIFTDGSLGAASRFVKVTPNADVEGIEERRRLPVREDA